MPMLLGSLLNRRMNRWTFNTTLVLALILILYPSLVLSQVPPPGGSGGLNVPNASDSIEDSKPGSEKKQQITNLPPKIAQLDASCLSPEGMKLTIRGSNFGSGKDSSIRLNGKQTLRTDSWSNTRIKANVPAGKYGHESIELWQNGKRITARNIRGCRELPKIAKPDTASPTAPDAGSPTGFGSALPHPPEPGATARSDDRSDSSGIEVAPQDVQLLEGRLPSLDGAVEGTETGVGAEALRSNISEHVVDASSLRLTINGGTAPAIVAHSDSGGSANLEWSVPDRLGEQFLLLISDGIVPGSNRCPDEVATRRRGETDPEEHAQRHSSNGNIDLNLSSYLGEHTYFIWGCALRGGSLNGHSTNVVAMRYGYSLDITDFGTGGPEVLPNLQVSNVAVDQDNPTRFIVTINNVNGPLDWTWARAYRAHRNRVLGTEQTIEELLTFAVYLSVENRGSGYPSDLAHAVLDPSSGQQQVIVTSPWSFPIDGEPHRIRVFVNEDLDVLESNYDDNSLIFTRQLEPRQLNIVLFGMNQMQVHYDGDDGSGPGELLRIERSMGRYNGDGTYSGGPNVSPSHMRNETSRALHGSSVDYLLIHDGDLLDTPFPSSRTTLAEDQTLRILFSARDDDSPCLSGRCYEQGVSVYDLDLATVPVVPGGCAENTHDFSGLLEARGPSVPDLPGPILRPTNGQYCVYYRYSPGVVSTEE